MFYIFLIHMRGCHKSVTSPHEQYGTMATSGKAEAEKMCVSQNVRVTKCATEPSVIWRKIIGVKGDVKNIVLHKIRKGRTKPNQKYFL